jgi:nitrate reductase gamma subunit
MIMPDFILFVVFPWLAVLLAVVLGIFRFVRDRTAFTSLSSQFLEKEALFRGSASWHYGILILLLAHAFALLFPRLWRILGGTHLRLWGMEISGMVLALLALAGLVTLMVRRIVNPRVRAVTSAFDWVLEACLIVEVGLGFLVAVLYRWGSQWYLATAVPWLASLARFKPRTDTIANLPLLAKAHFLGAFVLLALFPFGRLLHIATSRLSYLFRASQVVVWNARRRGRRTHGQAAG